MDMKATATFCQVYDCITDPLVCIFILSYKLSVALWYRYAEQEKDAIGNRETYQMTVPQMYTSIIITIIII